VEVDILYHPVTGERSTTFCKMLGDRPPAHAAPEPSGERFSLENVRVTINGKTIGTAEYLDAGGGLMIYLPGRGESYLALVAVSGLPPSGVRWIDHNI